MQASRTRGTPRTALAVTLLLTLLGGGMVATEALALCPPLDPQNDGTAYFPIPDLVIAEIAPGDFLVLFNTTGAPILIDAVTHNLYSPFNSIALSVAGSGVTVPALGFAVIPWPGFFTDVDAGGEIILRATPGAVPSGVVAPAGVSIAVGSDGSGTALSSVLGYLVDA